MAKNNSGDSFAPKGLDGYKINPKILLNGKAKKTKVIEFLPMPENKDILPDENLSQ